MLSHLIRLMFRNRAATLSRKAAAADLPKLREDPRWASVVNPTASGVASVHVDGYLAVKKRQ